MKAFPPDSTITVSKRNHLGEETWRYTGQVLENGSSFIKLQAFFEHPDAPFFEMFLENGDRMIETFYTDRWYNVFEIRSRKDDWLKGWYCNIGYPAQLDEQGLSYRDLALDLLVYADGRYLVLDQEEFESLPLSPTDREQALNALKELQCLFQARRQG